MSEPRLITSLTNDTVKAVRALHMRKEREATGRFLAEGLKFIGEALDQGRTPTLLMVGMEARPHPLLDRAMAVPGHYGTVGLPVTLFLGADGRLVRAHVGEIAPEQIDAELARLR